MRNTKIVCTLGPASSERATIRALADAGMSVARLNASHGTTSERSELIERVRAVDDATTDPLAVMIDLQGPEVRTADFEGEIELNDGQEIRLVEGTTVTSEEIGLTDSISDVSPGDTVLLADGHIETTVERVEDHTVVATVDSGGSIDSRTGLTIPGVDLELDLIGSTDRDELELAAEREVDFVAASFVRDAADVYEVADTIEGYGGDDVAIVAKIERSVAVENLNEIVDAADGVMIARGDLGVECPLEDVPIVQKRIITRCLDEGVPVITATEMLDSMIHARRPTRAEVSDVANAVLDGTDAVMLSGETAVGDSPVRTVETMDRIVRRIESSDEYANTREQRVPAADGAVRTDALARSARYLARDVGATAIVAVSESGYTARKAAKFRPGVPVITTTPNDRVRRRLAMSWGIDARSVPYETDVETVLERAIQAALDSGLVESGDTIVLLSGMLTELSGTGTTNTLKVHVVAETVATGRSVVDGRATAPLVRLEDGDLSAISDPSVVFLPPDFEEEFEGDTSVIAGIVAARTGMTGYPAIVAREIGVPMISGASIPGEVAGGTVVTVDGERGVVYEGDVTSAGAAVDRIRT